MPTGLLGHEATDGTQQRHLHVLLLEILEADLDRLSRPDHFHSATLKVISSCIQRAEAAQVLLAV